MERQIVLAIQQDGNHGVDGEGDEEVRRGDLGGVEDPGGKVEDRDGAGVEEQGMVVGDQTHLKVEKSTLLGKIIRM